MRTDTAPILTRSSLTDYSREEMEVLLRPATRCRMTWTGSRWLARVTWEHGGDVLRYSMHALDVAGPDRGPTPSDGSLDPARCRAAIEALMGSVSPDALDRSAEVTTRVDDPASLSD